MARLDDLAAEVKDAVLRRKLQDAIADLKRKQRFGLVFEEHIPETSALLGFPVQPGETVQRRDEVTGNTLYRVSAVNGRGKATVEPLGGGELSTISARDLLVVKRFGDPIYPALTSVGAVRRGADDRPWHAVVNGENFHALQLFVYLYEGQVDCIYIDPPYNTGARDWKYNNRYVDDNDSWRHSKWLSMMEKRLRLAKRLLNPADSVLIVTIDENEVHHLGLLLERVFPEARMQMVSVAINPAAVARTGYFGRADEYYFFLMFGDAKVRPTQLSDEWITTKGRTHKGEIRWDLLRRSGSSPTRQGHPETFYPFFITKDGSRFHSVGEPIGVGAKREDTVPPEGTIAVWPIRQNGSEGRWRLKPQTVRKALEAGYLRIGALKGEKTPIYCLAEGERRKIKNGTYYGLRPSRRRLRHHVNA
jgi:adenine-specific DNA-methyltransferase